MGVLYRREEFGLDTDPLRGGRLTELYDRVKHFSLQFWDGQQWRAEWSAKRELGKLPRAVRVELRILLQERDDRNVEQFHVTTVTFAK